MTKIHTSANFCLLLTGNIAPQAVPNLERIDVTHRENDYINAISKWLSLGYPLVFCENSGYQSTQINNQLEGFPNRELIQFNTQASIHGKGHGEAEIIAFAMNHSKILQNFDGWIIKITGRYFVKNFLKIIEKIPQDSSTIIVANLEDRLRYADSRFFLFKRTFYEKFLFLNMPEINEKKGIYFEHILAKATLLCISQGNRCSFMCCPPLYEGFYATKNIKYRNDIFRVIKKHTIHYMRRWAFEYKSY